MKKAIISVSILLLSLGITSSVLAVGSGGGGGAAPSSPPPTEDKPQETTSTGQSSTNSEQPAETPSNTSDEHLQTSSQSSAQTGRGKNEAASKIICGNKTNMRERIFCRLNLAPEDLAEEHEYKYLPEECRALAATDQNKCVNRYKSYQPCWSVKAGEERFNCARNILKLGRVISEEVKNCRNKTGSEQSACKNETKEKVFAIIKFRFYDLEERAEKLAEKGVSLQTVADFENTIEAKKQAFNQAQTFEERKQIILDVRQAWQEFVSKARAELKK